MWGGPGAHCGGMRPTGGGPWGPRPHMTGTSAKRASSSFASPLWPLDVGGVCAGRGGRGEVCGRATWDMCRGSGSVASARHTPCGAVPFDTVRGSASRTRRAIKLSTGEREHPPPVAGDKSERTIATPGSSRSVQQHCTVAAPHTCVGGHGQALTDPPRGRWVGALDNPGRPPHLPRRHRSGPHISMAWASTPVPEAGRWRPAPQGCIGRGAGTPPPAGQAGRSGWGGWAGWGGWGGAGGAPRAPTPRRSPDAKCRLQRHL